jgi:Zn-dependent protease with chaperone function
MALLLMVGFYGFALIISLGLLWIPYAEYVYLERVHIKIAIGCIGGAAAVLWALVPRADKFEAPGPRLTPANAPHLFTIIEAVAKATAQPRPEEIYLLNDVNAWVTHRGGVMGVGSHRVMGVGLPLIEGLSPAELRAVIAHEFGHYVSGDVALGPWIHKTRAAIGRALQGVPTFLEFAFDWYARMFMRMTMMVSREQEFVADATAARVAGVESAISALKRVSVLAPAYSMFVNNEVMPVLRAGFLPPISEGFKRFLSDPGTSRALEGFAADTSMGADAGEFDTHPPMAERVAALKQINQPAAHTEEPTLPSLKDPDRHARALLEHKFGRDNVAKLKAIPWEEVALKVYGEMWQAVAQPHAKWLASFTTDQIPVDRPRFLTKGSELVGRDESAVSPEERVARAVHVLTAGLGATLLRNGWTIETAPGRPIEVVKGEARLDPHRLVSQLAEGTMSSEAWQAKCVTLGISGVRLACYGEAAAGSLKGASIRA